MTDISVIVPTFNERDNLPEILTRIHTALNGRVPFEMIVVDDDSPDLTWQLAHDLRQTFPQLRVLRRIEKKGLSSAVVDGFLMATGAKLAVIDADLQHDASILPEFSAELEQHDFVVGSRKADGGGIDGWSKRRRFVSWSATVLANTVLGTYLNDPMSGYFGVRRDVFERILPEINPKGFKILLELIHRAGSRKIKEVGYTFKPRLHGQSKLSTSVVLDFLFGIFSLKFGRYIPVSFVKFSLVGGLGVVINLVMLKIGLDGLGWPESQAVMAAILVAMVSNYFLNNAFTFKESQLSGLGVIVGLFKFAIVSSLGALINYSVTMFLNRETMVGIYAAQLAGIAIATIWNYVLNAKFTWNQG